MKFLLLVSVFAILASGHDQFFTKAQFADNTNSVIGLEPYGGDTYSYVKEYDGYTTGLVDQPNIFSRIAQALRCIIRLLLLPIRLLLLPFVLIWKLLRFGIRVLFLPAILLFKVVRLILGPFLCLIRRLFGISSVVYSF